MDEPIPEYNNPVREEELVDYKREPREELDEIEVARNSENQLEGDSF